MLLEKTKQVEEINFIYGMETTCCFTGHRPQSLPWDLMRRMRDV